MKWPSALLAVLKQRGFSEHKGTTGDFLIDIKALSTDYIGLWIRPPDDDRHLPLRGDCGPCRQAATGRFLPVAKGCKQPRVITQIQTTPTTTY